MTFAEILPKDSYIFLLTSVFENVILRLTIEGLIMKKKLVAFRIDEKLMMMLKKESNRQGKEGNISFTIRKILNEYFYGRKK